MPFTPRRLSTLPLPRVPAMAAGFALAFGAAGPAPAKDPSAAEALPRLQGRVVVVEDAAALARAVAAVSSDTTILLKEGHYALEAPLEITGSPRARVALRGYHSKPSEITLRPAAGARLDHLLAVDEVEDLLVSDLTFAGGETASIKLGSALRGQPRLHHCVFAQSGAHALLGTRTRGVHVEFCRLSGIAGASPESGVEIQGGTGWVVRHCRFENMRGAAALRAWGGASGTLCSANTFFDCPVAVIYGRQRQQVISDHRGGAIENNFIVLPPTARPADGALVRLTQSPATRVVHNSILTHHRAPTAISVRFPTDPPPVIANNLSDRGVDERDGAFISLEGNRFDVSPSVFRRGAAGDLHLVDDPGLDRVRAQPALTYDWDGHPISRGGRSLPGADQPAD